VGGQVCGLLQQFREVVLRPSACEEQLIVQNLIEKIIVGLENFVGETCLWLLPKGEVAQIDQMINQ
jgi:hypothetical protein